MLHQKDHGLKLFGLICFSVWYDSSSKRPLINRLTCRMISVVIPAYNEENAIIDTIEEIRNGL